MSKYIVVVGGVISGVGKGIAAASLALLMKLRGHSVQYIKLDGYLAVNAGILRPSEHGETYVLDDGSETDCDLGSVYRIANIEMSKKNICTAGTLYKQLIQEQEAGKYLGSTVQIIPHFTDLIKERLTSLGKDADVVVVEIGGTVGDIESAAFFEAVRQLKCKKSIDLVVVMVAPILWVQTIREFKTKPLQNAVKELQKHGLQPDVLLCRVDRPVPSDLLDKVSGLTNVGRECIFDAPDVPSIYKVPVEFYDRHVDDLVVDMLHIRRTHCRIHKQRELIEKEPKEVVKIGIFGKYKNADESYMSIKEALYHSGAASDVKVDIKWINSEDFEKNYNADVFNDLHGVIVPGGFDSRGVEGKIKAIQYARENKIPFLGICLGLQCAVIEYARNFSGIKANSQEFDAQCENPVVCYMAGQETVAKSASMRLGAYECELVKGSLASELYGKKLISERHRHRLEVNSKYKGLNVSGNNPKTGLIEIMELGRDTHPFFLGCQFHPEFTSRLALPSPLFVGLVKAAAKYRDKGEHGKLLA